MTGVGSEGCLASDEQELLNSYRQAQLTVKQQMMELVASISFEQTNSFGYRLRAERESLNLTQIEMAKRTEVPISLYTSYEQDRYSPPSTFLPRLIQQGIDVMYLLTGERTKASQPIHEGILR